jgi:elongator complex protein 4
VAGLLHLRKLPSLGAAAAPVPEVALHLVRHKRRRLAITPVEIDPEAELADAEAASGAGKTAAAVLCGGPTSGGRQASLEF